MALTRLKAGGSTYSAEMDAHERASRDDHRLQVHLERQRGGIGMRAKSEQEVRSPLLEAGMSKEDVRELSRHLELPTWDKPSFACLSSRFPYGTGITRENLSRIDRAETLLRDARFRRFRVRFHDETTARIEVDPSEMERLLEPGFRAALVGQLKELGFVYVTLDLQGYRTGSMNEVLSAGQKAEYLKGK